MKLKYFFNETQGKLLMFSNVGCVNGPEYKYSILQGIEVVEGLVVFFDQLNWYFYHFSREFKASIVAQFNRR